MSLVMRSYCIGAKTADGEEASLQPTVLMGKSLLKGFGPLMEKAPTRLTSSKWPGVRDFWHRPSRFSAQTGKAVVESASS